MAKTNQPPAPSAIPRGDKEFVELFRRAENGDKSTLPAIRELLQLPGNVALFGGDLVRQVERSLAEMLGGENLPYKEALFAKARQMRAELAGPDAAPIEKLLAERVVLTWMQVHTEDFQLAQKEAGLTFQQGEYHQRARDRAHARYLGSIKMLALVRKLALPVLQVNIAKKQINVGQGQVNATTANEAR